MMSGESSSVRVFRDGSQLGVKVAEIVGAGAEVAVSGPSDPVSARPGMVLAIVVRSPLSTVDWSSLCELAAAHRPPEWILVTELSTAAVRQVFAAASPVRVIWDDDVSELSSLVEAYRSDRPMAALLSGLLLAADTPNVVRQAAELLLREDRHPRTVSGIAVRLGVGEDTLRRAWAAAEPAERSLKRVLDCWLIERWLVAAKVQGVGGGARHVGVSVRTLQRMCLRVAGGRPSELLSREGQRSTRLIRSDDDRDGVAS